jgi:pimeloyl-ACP methyl ester carboxylesterase
MIIRTLHWLLGSAYHGLGFASRSVTVSGHALHYYESPTDGRHHTVVFLHGLGTSASTWALVLPRLRALGHIIALDLPGFGRSRLPEPTSVPTFADYLEILRAFLRTVVPGSASLVGHSLGGWLAMHLALEGPRQVRKLVLMNPAGIWYEGCEQVAAAFDVHELQDTRRLLERLWFNYPWYFRPFLGPIHNELRSRRVFDLVRTIRREEFVNERLHDLQCATSVLWGQEDRLLSATTVAVLRREIPTVQVIMIPRCGHVPQLECPGRTVEALRLVLDADRG